jgi:hypothetical protein
MAAGLSQATDSMTQGKSLLDTMTDAGSDVWQGAAGDAFRSNVNDRLGSSLANAHSSLNTAVNVLKSWHGDLVGHKDYAATLDRAAGDAKAAVARTKAAYEQARNNPAFQLVHQTFSTQDALRQAQAKVDAAESALRDAGNAPRAPPTT